MRKFTDSKGQSWVLDVTAGVLLDIKTDLGVNLLDSPDEMPTSIEKMVEILWVTLKDQAAQRNMSPRDFASVLGGDALFVAFDLWMQEWADFFVRLSPGRTQLIRGTWGKAKELEGAKSKILEKAFSSTSGDWLERLELIPGALEPGS
jgi:hypothetical protein